jgi:hypothetical protein
MWELEILLLAFFLIFFVIILCKLDKRYRVNRALLDLQQRPRPKPVRRQRP